LNSTRSSISREQAENKDTDSYDRKEKKKKEKSVKETPQKQSFVIFVDHVFPSSRVLVF